MRHDEEAIRDFWEELIEICFEQKNWDALKIICNMFGIPLDELQKLKQKTPS